MKFHFHTCHLCGHSRIKCSSPPADPDGPAWGACEREVELETRGETFTCDVCADDAVSTIRRGRTK